LFSTISFPSATLFAQGTVVAWGAGKTNNPADLVDYGQSIVPAGMTNHVVAIAAGAFHSLAVENDGTVIGWGDNFQGQAPPPEGLGNVVAIAGGYAHSVAVQSNGLVVAWGDNTYGQTNVPSGLRNVAAIAGGYYHSLALKSDGTVVAWGFNANGQTNVPWN
jgi:alpha-tubulin suppressor-like RCC1 family protein